MWGKKFKFLNALSFLSLVFFAGTALAQSEEWGSQVNKTVEEIKIMEERMKFVESYLLNIEKLTVPEKALLRDSFDLKVKMYLLSDNKRSLKNLSVPVYENTMCMARKIGQKALIYTDVVIGQIFKNEEEQRRYSNAVEFLETLETPEYSEEKIIEMCDLKD